MVIKLMQSFKLKEYVEETFGWMHYYWFLTNEGIDFLTTYLNLPSEIVPVTLKKQQKPLGRRMGGPPGKSGAPADYQPSFRGPGASPGYGRGTGGFGGAGSAAGSDLP